MRDALLLKLMKGEIRVKGQKQFMLSKGKITELLKLKDDGFLYHRESKDLEFKEQFNLAGLGEYFKDFAGFANNTGGYLVFGITNSPRKLIGLNSKALEQFESIDPEKITGFLLDIFSPNIDWMQTVFEVEGKKFGIFYIREAKTKPVIAKKDEGKEQIIKNGDVFFRYGGRTQKIQYAELHNIIHKRIEEQNKYWINLMLKISKIGPSNAAILDAEQGIIEKNENQILIIDEDLAKKIKFLKEGEFSEKGGATTVKLVGDVHPIDSVEIVKFEKKNLLELYPLSCKQLIDAAKEAIPSVKQGEIYDTIKANNLKKNSDYAYYIFKNRSQEEEFEKNGTVPKGITSIYNKNAVDYIVKLLKNRTL